VPDYPENLAKFCSADTAREILTRQCLRWSAPHQFNDPFEPDHRTVLAFDPHVILDSVLRSVTGMIFSPNEPRGNAPLMTVIRRWREEERFHTQEEAEEVLRELMSRMVDMRQKELEELMADWRRYTRQLRICCFSAKPDNLSCWRHYGDNHRGLVIRFNAQALCGDKPLRAVEYRQARPEITTLKEQLNAVLYNEQPDAREKFIEKFLHKPLFSSNEQEWRAFFEDSDESSKSPDDNQWYDDLPFDPEALTGVYLGAAMSASQRKEFYELIKQLYPQCKIFQGQIPPGKYELDFQRASVPGTATANPEAAQ
jgi:hypothetical protein